MIAITVFPPSPTAISVLKTVKTIETLARDCFEFFQVSAAFWMSGRRTRSLNTTKDLVHRSLWFETEISQGLRRDHRWQEPAHSLFSATVRIVDQVRQCVEHGRRHAGCDLNGELSRVSAAFLRNVEFDRNAVASHLSRSGDEFLDAVLKDREALLHSIGILTAARFHLQFCFTGVTYGDKPINSGLAVGLYLHRRLRATHWFAINEQTSN